MFLLGVLLVSVASGFSLLWIYTSGRLDRASIERALPVIRRDVDATFAHIGKTAEVYYERSAETLGPFVKDAGVAAGKAWTEVKRRHQITAHWLNENVGPYACGVVQQAKRTAAWAAARAADGWAWLRPRMWSLWLAARPHFQRLGEMILEYAARAYEWSEANLPVYYDMAYEKVTETAAALTKAVDGVING